MGARSTFREFTLVFPSPVSIDADGRLTLGGDTVAVLRAGLAETAEALSFGAPDSALNTASIPAKIRLTLAISKTWRAFYQDRACRHRRCRRKRFSRSRSRGRKAAFDELPRATYAQAVGAKSGHAIVVAGAFVTIASKALAQVRKRVGWDALALVANARGAIGVRRAGLADPGGVRCAGARADGVGEQTGRVTAASLDCGWGEDDKEGRG